MNSCTIIVFNYESIGFLRVCIEQIRKYAVPEMGQHIIIADQSIKERDLVKKEFGKNADVTIINMDALCSGYGLDYILQKHKIDSEYICTLDCDAFPTHKEWLTWPISLLKPEGFKFVGGVFFESNFEPIYPPTKFFCMTQCYRVGRTEDYKMLAFHGGFSRFNVRDRGELNYANDDWAKWGGNGDSWSDDAVIAHYWEDKYLTNNKLGLPITHSMGREFGDSDWGAIIDGMVFHLGYSHWSNTIEDNVGKNYGYWKGRLGNGENIVEEMVAIAANYPTGAKAIVWDGTEKRTLNIFNKI